MIKNTVIVLATAAAVAGISLPAMASGSLIATSENSFDPDYVIAQLKDQGVNATAVEEWGDYVVAYVTGADGKQTLAYFTPTTLQPVNL